jgi:hypothetical protein
VCSPHTRPAPTLCTPKGECTPFASSHCRGRARRPPRRLPLSRARQVCRTRSARRPAPSVRSGLCGVARSPSHSLPGGHRRLVRHAAAEGTTNDSVPTQLSTPSSLRSSSACLPTVPTVRKRGCPAVHCVERAPIRGNPIACAALARRRVARRPKISSLAHRPAQRRSPRPHGPMLQPTGDAEG